MKGHPGRVSSIREHEGGKHVTVEVTHGKRKREKQPDGSVAQTLSGWHRPSSSIVMPKSEAAQYQVGQKVHVGCSPAESSVDELAERKAAKAPPKKKAPPSRIASAMGGGY